MTEVRRVHVVGASGSGKTTLARRVAACLGAPAYDLDEVAYEGGFARKRTLDERRADVERIAAGPSWVTEGVFLWWTDQLMQAADVVVWLDLPWRVTAWRIVLRHVAADLAGTNKHRGYRKLARFVRATRGYYTAPPASAPPAADDDSATTRAETARYLAAHADKLVHCRRPADVEAFARRVCGVRL